MLELNLESVRYIRLIRLTFFITFYWILFLFYSIHHLHQLLNIFLIFILRNLWSISRWVDSIVTHHFQSLVSLLKHSSIIHLLLLFLFYLRFTLLVLSLRGYYFLPNILTFVYFSNF